MPAESEAQRRLMAIAEHHPSEVNKENRGVLKMDHKQLHDFASTKEKGLPEHKHKDGEHHSGGMDHKAAVAKMHPEHVHRLVQHAMSGKAGPEAQQMAQQAMQPQQDPDQMQEPAEQKYGQMFSGMGGEEQQEAPPNRVSMFGGSR